ncbi:MAG TPA: chaperonin GroEL [Gammaproteobacteria bacterium]|nr:chaperonin GroEL [Gammaproteobacteria bacterium]
MAHKRLLFHGEAQTRVLKGANALADAVRITLGPKSKSVLIQRKFGRPLVCNDGVTIAREVSLDDPEENLGVQMMREAAERTGEAVGDGTTTATLLAHTIYSEGLKNIAAGASAVDLKRGLDHGLKCALAKLGSLSRPVKGAKEIEQTATVSAHNNPAIGKIIADAIQKVGVNGVVSLEESQGTETVVEVVEGMRFDRGYMSPYFINNTERLEVVLENPFVLLTDRKILSVKDIVPLLEKVVQAARPLLIVADEVEGEALATLIVNKARGLLGCVAVKAPSYGDRRHAILEDIAILTGATLATEQLGLTLDKLTLKDLGSAKRVTVTASHTTIVGGAGDKTAIQARIRQLESEIEMAASSYDRDHLKERHGKLAGGVAVIRVGAASESEIATLKDAYEDSIAATRAAIEEGIVPGGGLALIRLAQALEDEEAKGEGDMRTGIRVLRASLAIPAGQIALNSNQDDGVVVNQLRTSAGNTGFDAATGQFVDLMESGITDPTKVVRIALENAVSVAGTLLLTEATLTELPEKTEPRTAVMSDEV